MNWPWQKVKVVERVKVVQQADYRSKLYDERTKALRAEVEAHSPYCSDIPGCGTFGRNLWCSQCRTVWPCRFVFWAVETEGSEVDERWERPKSLPSVAASLSSGAGE